MAYEFLKNLFGENKEGEQPKSMTYEELEAAIDASKNLTLVNIADGGYVAQADYDALGVELDGVKTQLDTANTTITSYKDMDIEGIKKSASDWEEKYRTDTKALQDKLDAQAYSHAVERASSDIKFSSNASRKAFLADLNEKGLKLEGDKLLGFEDYVSAYRESDPGAFVVENPSSEPNRPYFGRGSGGTPVGSQGKKMTLTEKMRYMAEHPEASVNSLFE